MAKLALTDLSIRRFLPAKDAPVYYWDTHMAGLGLRVTRSSKAFVVLLGSGQRKTIGRYPILSLAEARSEAKRILAERTLGKRIAPSLAFETVRDRFLAACLEKNRPRTVKDYTRLLRFFPLKGKLGNVMKHHIVERLDMIKSPSERAHALVVIKVFFRWAERQGYVDASPCNSLRVEQRPGQRERVLTDDELRRVWHQAAKAAWPFGAIVQLLVLTGQRRGEIGLLRWEWIDEKDRTITLPGTMTKNRRTSGVPYGAMTAAVFEGYRGSAAISSRLVRRRCGVGPRPSSMDGAKRRSPSTALSRTTAGGAFVTPWTLHDLRRTFATNLAALGVPVQVTEKLLNHVSGTISGVAAIYNRHAYMDEMRSAIAAWESRLSKIIYAKISALATPIRESEN